MKPESKLLLFALTLFILALGIALFAPNILSGTAFAQRPPPGGPKVPSALAGTAFTYQGQLKNNGALVNGNCDFQFGLWNDPATGPQYGATQTVSSLPVTNGLFTTPIDFGGGTTNYFTGTARYLQVAVNCGGGLTTLSPRQALTPAPYALALLGLYTQQNATSPNVIGGNNGNSVNPGKYGVTIGGGGGITDAFGSACASCYNSINANYATIGGGLGNVITSTGWYATIGGGVLNTASGGNATIAGGGAYNTASGNWATIGGGDGNTASGQRGTIGGGSNNTASNQYATIGGGLSNSSGPTATVGGGSYNNASGGAATVGGGYFNFASGGAATVGGGYFNTASVDYATVGGGQSNTASSSWATLGGGTSNNASGGAATVGGGQSNTASSSWATIGGGYLNFASGIGGATIGGGLFNTASGYAATVGGGASNTASGDYSFAAGQHANTNNKTGAFVWGDNSSISDVNAPVNNSFIVRASGGITMYTNSGLSAGVQIAPGGGSWGSVSDRSLKANFAPTNGQEILAHLNNLPIQTWNYRTQDASIRHIGPMAQDFYAAFQVGEDDKHITTIDADGVALAAIQGLYQIVQEKDVEIKNLKSQSEKQQAKIENLETRLAALEQGGGTQLTARVISIMTNGVDWNTAIALVMGALGVVAYERARRGGVG